MASGIVPKLSRFLRTYPHELFTVAFFVFLYAFVSRQSFDGEWWVEWAQMIRDFGFAKIYTHEAIINYLPGALYFIDAWQHLLSFLHIPLNEKTAYTFKLFPMFFDALTVLLCFRLVKKFKLSAAAVYIGLLFNIAFQFNSYIWGQVDSIYTFFVFLSLYLLNQKKTFWGLVAFLLALNFKVQALVMVPVIGTACGLNLLASDRVQCGKYAILRGTVLLGLIQAVIFAPFASSPIQILRIVWEKGVNMGAVLSWNAYNFWILIGASPMNTLSYDLWYGGLSYKLWGYLLFGVASTVSLLPYFLTLVLLAYSKVAEKNVERTQKLSAWLRTSQSWLLSSLTAYLVSLSFFFFLSDMHERYSHPTILFSFLIGLFSKNYWILVLTSAAYFFNMNNVVDFFTVLNPHYEKMRFMSALFYLVAFILGMHMLFASTLKNLSWVKVQKKHA